MLLISILISITVIVKKHYRRSHELHCQETLKDLLNKAAYSKQTKSEHLKAIQDINVAIQNNQFDTFCAWNLILESADDLSKRTYIKIFLKLNYLNFLSKALYSSNLKRRCLAMQMIGICKLKAFTPELIKYLENPVLSSYASMALTRIHGIESINTINLAFHNKKISTSQLLSALIEIPKKDLIGWHKKRLNKNVNNLISKYI